MKAPPARSGDRNSSAPQKVTESSAAEGSQKQRDQLLVKQLGAVVAKACPTAKYAVGRLADHREYSAGEQRECIFGSDNSAHVTSVVPRKSAHADVTEVDAASGARLKWQLALVEANVTIKHAMRLQCLRRTYYSYHAAAPPTRSA